MDNASSPPDCSGPGLPVSALGLGPVTLSRLRRLEVADVSQLAEVSPEDLWRCLGRACLVDLLGRLRTHGLPLPELNHHQLCRLGLADPQALAVVPHPYIPFESLWPRVSRVLCVMLAERGFDTVIEAVPRNEDEVRMLYRLGKGNLRVLLEVFEAALEHSPPEARAILSAGVGLIHGWIDTPGRTRRGRTSTRGKGVRARSPASDASSASAGKA